MRNRRPPRPFFRSLSPIRVPWLAACVCLVGCPRQDTVPPVDEGSAEIPAAMQRHVLLESPGNDRPDRATLLARGATVRGAVEGGAPDYLRVEGAAQGVRLRLEADDDVAALLVVPRDGAERSFVSAGAGVLEADLRSDSPVFVRLDGAGAWQISSEEAPYACGFSGEPDGVGSPGARITSVPGRASGCLATPGDEDVIEVPMHVLASEDAFGAWVGGVPGVSMQVVAAEESGRVLFDLSGGPGESLAIPSVRSPSEGGLSLRVRSLSGANDEVPWTVELRRLPSLNGLIESEPNDTPETASIIDSVDIVNGWFHRPGDVDHYRIESSETRVLRMRVTPPDGTDILIAIPDGPARPASQIDEARVGGEEVLCSVRVGPDLPFPFSIRARSTQGDVIEPYILSFDIFDAQGFEIESNDALHVPDAWQERRLSPPQLAGIWVDDGPPRLSATGHIFPRGDIDHFLVEIYDDPLASITFTSVTFRLDPNGPASYHLEILDFYGAVVARSTGRGPGEGLDISLDLPGGRYWARVSLAEGEPCGPPYRLSLEQTAYPDRPAFEPSRREPTNSTTGDRLLDPTALEPSEGSGDSPTSLSPSGGNRPPVAGPPPRPRPGIEREPVVRPRPTPEDGAGIRISPPSDGPPARTW